MEIKKLQSSFKMPTLKRVCAYARVSSGKESMLHSLASQVSYYSSYIQTHRDWLYCGVYSDEDFTGTKNDRPGFQTMLQKAKNHEIDIILTKSISRFARNTVDLIKTIRELRELKVDVWFEQEHIQSMSPQGDLLLTLLASSAQEESRATSERMKWAIKHRFEEGKIWSSEDTFGYRLKGQEMTIQNEEADIVRLIYKLYLEGNGKVKILKVLQNCGVKPLKGEWSTTTIYRILTNPTYVGDLLFGKKYRENHLTKKLLDNKGEKTQYLVSDHHKAIIDRTTFDNVQNEIKRRALNYKKQPNIKPSHPLTGMIECAICGCLYRYKNVAGNKVYVCRTFNTKGKDVCPSKQIPEPIIYTILKDRFGLLEINTQTIKATFSKIIAKPGNIITFILKNGSSVDCEWKDRSRRDSWTPEMKQRMSILKKGNVVCQK